MAPDRVPREGPVAIVTGASRGIGAAIAETLAQRDATVIVSAHAADPPDALRANMTRGPHGVRRSPRAGSQR